MCVFVEEADYSIFYLFIAFETDSQCMYKSCWLISNFYPSDASFLSSRITDIFHHT